MGIGDHAPGNVNWGQQPAGGHIDGTRRNDDQRRWGLGVWDVCALTLSSGDRGNNNRERY